MDGGSDELLGVPVGVSIVQPQGEAGWTRVAPAAPVAASSSLSHPTSSAAPAASSSASKKVSFAAKPTRTVEERMQSLLDELFMSHDVPEAVILLQEFDFTLSPSLSPDDNPAFLLLAAVLESGKNSEAECRLFTSLCSKGVAAIGASFAGALKAGVAHLLPLLDDIALDVPSAPKHFSAIRRALSL